QEARSLIETGISEIRSAFETRGLAACLQTAGDLAFIYGDYKAAEKHYQEALEIAKAIDSDAHYQSVAHCLGMLAYENGDIKQMKAYYRTYYQGNLTVDTITSLGYVDGIAFLALLLARLGKPVVALRLLGTLQAALGQTNSADWLCSRFQERTLSSLQKFLTE